MEGDCEAKLATANEISVDAAVAAVLSEPGGVFTLKKKKEQHWKALEAFIALIWSLKLLLKCLNWQ